MGYVLSEFFLTHLFSTDPFFSRPFLTDIIFAGVFLIDSFCGGPFFILTLVLLRSIVGRLMLSVVCDWSKNGIQKRVAMIHRSVVLCSAEASERDSDRNFVGHIHILIGE